MIIYFISIWPSDSGLSHSTVHPHLAVLAADARVTQIVYFSMESTTVAPYQDLSGKVRHVPIVQPDVSPKLLLHALRHRHYLAVIVESARHLSPDLVICRGAPAGIYGHHLKVRTGAPYFVESFEPHAEYMRQSGTWSPYGMKYWIEKGWEAKVKRTADGLITVSSAYATYLDREEHIDPARLLTVPCWVDPRKFYFDPERRRSLRAELGIGDALALIYVGKFGGLYQDKAVLGCLAALRQAGLKLHFIALTPDDPTGIAAVLQAHGFPAANYTIRLVAPEAVPDYLSAADVAVSFWGSGAWSFACSPIKHGEYWACGLPLLMPPGVGDESNWLEDKGLGALVNFYKPESVVSGYKKVLDIIAAPDHRSRIREIGLSERSQDKLLVAYNMLIERAFFPRKKRGSS